MTWLQATTGLDETNDSRLEDDKSLEGLLERLEPMLSERGILYPHEIAQPAFDAIWSTVHLAWIRQVLRPKTATQFGLNLHVQEALCTVSLCKSDIWTIREGIRILCDENPIIATASSDQRQGELDNIFKKKPALGGF